MNSLMLDGNAAAGLLREVFAVEMTTALATCGGCGATEPIGAVRVFRGASMVLRCPHCGDVLGTLAERDTEIRLSLAGVRTLAVSR